ncbi:hypothetical protein GYMLUDRAFT_233400 [Collybiopsis luxurians FD-317 M1]|uniref:Unplaced genomic scaffold GYMLUscaffold_93, whole genome shotgun sequence n=1 Tax=Collybiopsis luxurians FD-317 M1 TaxID=944289 RepID=A0A0D0CCF2_9AGAR|nr:hypothetical protein GYMLUDRAFT_233400 [Collybiopsis luxurians FD-317 M1]
MEQPLNTSLSQQQMEKQERAAETIVIPDTSQEQDIQEGGIRGWATVFGAWLVQFTMVGMATSFGATQEFYVLHFLSQSTPSQINWIGSVQLFFQFTVGLAVTKLLDLGKFTLLKWSGGLLYIFSMFMLSLSKPEQYYQVFLSQGVGMGVATGMLYMPCARVVSSHFRRHRGLVLGIITTGSSLGGFTFSTLLTHLLERASFGSSIRTGAYISLACLISANLLMRQYPAGARKEHPAAASASNPSPVKASLLKPSFVLIVLYGFVTALGLWFPVISIQLFAHQHPLISARLTPWLLAIINLSGTAGRVIPNWLSDRFGALKVNLATTTISGIMAFIMIICTTSASIVIFCIFYGFFAGATVALFFPSVISLDSNAQSGIRLGLACVPSGIASLIGTPIAAALVGQQQKWWAGCVFTGAIEIMGSFLLIGCLLLNKKGY